MTGDSVVRVIIETEYQSISKNELNVLSLVLSIETLLCMKEVNYTL
jgi:hypothetical protein